MIERYTDSRIDDLFSDQARYAAWAEIECQWLEARVSCGVVPSEAVKQAREARIPKPEEVADWEAQTGHDVVAFLRAWTAQMPDATLSRWVHFGLTSSDVVDTVQFQSMAKAADIVAGDIERLLGEVFVEAIDRHRASYRLGRTHGRVAEPHSWGLRLDVLAGSFARAHTRLAMARDVCSVMKMPGAVGTSSIGCAHNLNDVARMRGITGATTGSQVVPRDAQSMWATAMVAALQACEQAAMEIRLSSRAEVAEVSEGSARDRVGSSAMPGKRNPITSEKITGLARLGRGYLLALLESEALHHERDISHSSVERVAVTDLAHVTAHGMTETIRVFKNLEVDTAQMRRNLEQAGVGPYVSLAQALLVSQFNWATMEIAQNMIGSAIDRAGTNWLAFRRTFADTLLDHEGTTPQEVAQFWEALDKRANPEWMLRNTFANSTADSTEDEA